MPQLQTYLPYIIGGLLCLSVSVFFIATITWTARRLIGTGLKSKRSKLFFPLKLIITYALLPLYLLLLLVPKPSLPLRLPRLPLPQLLRRLIRTTFKIWLVLVVIAPVWVLGYAFIGLSIREYLGYNPDPIMISGTGSMYPTFPKGEGQDPLLLSKQVVGTPGMIPYPNGIVIRGKRYLNHELGRGDIVVVENDEIRQLTAEVYGRQSGWVKRLIGLPGDTIELRSGLVYLNGQPLLENYTATARSSFGGQFLSECHQVTVPPEYIFIMGDNRKGSGDSREIGFVELSAVNHVLPLNDQIGRLDALWRDSSNDLSESAKIHFDATEYVRLLNQKRQELGVEEVTYQPKLELSATKRAENILSYNDFSFEATKSGYTMERAMREANYSNIIWGEGPIQGYYEASELIENQLQFPRTVEFLTKSTYQDVGIGVVEGELNGCPTQLIVQHFAGYVPPNYEPETVASWRQSLERIKAIQGSWSSLKNVDSFYDKYKTDVDRINEIISIRINNQTAIVARMESNQWLSQAERQFIEQDQALYQEQQSLAEKLNSSE